MTDNNQTEMNQTETTSSDERQIVHDIVGKARFAMLTTVEPDGRLTSRPMTVQTLEDDWTVLFITQRDTNTAQLADGAQVNLGFQDDGNFVSLSGVARLSDDVEKKKELWNAANDKIADGGPEDPNTVILAVKAESAEYWSSPATPVVLVKLAAAKLTGSKPDLGTSGTVEL